MSTESTPTLARLRENLIDLELALSEQGMDDATADRHLAEIHAQYRATRDALKRHELRVAPRVEDGR